MSDDVWQWSKRVGQCTYSWYNNGSTIDKHNDTTIPILIFYLFLEHF